MTVRLGAVIFDLDGLILDTEPLARVGWRRALAEWGYALSDADFFSMLGLTLAGVEPLLRQRLGDVIPFSAMAERKQQYVREQIEQAGIPIKPGLFSLLDWLDAHARPYAIASATARANIAHKLGLTHLTEHFPVYVGSDEVAHSKPAPDLFLEAAHRLAAPPARCVVLEDSEAGLQAAQAAGMRAIMVPDLKPPTPALAQQVYRVCPSLAEVPAVLAELL